MPKFSQTSADRLASCATALRNLFDTVIGRYDCTVLEGHRSPARQLELFRAGRSKVKSGMHNKMPSLAVDAAPWLPGRSVPWPKTPSFFSRLSAAERAELNAYAKDMGQFYHFAGYVEGTADALGIAIRWGGDWDRDHCLTDQTFDDLVHFELHGPTPAEAARAEDERAA